ncbi:NAD(P)-binding domain-containing protein [Streptomyces sp. H27-G5]|uniref:pyrroline-5-carboxylate reductase family protein n=1 Tax=Streptomyces sp. H27-G5 TaxID=2996698 RepID=UPI00226E4DB6|nr:NAD(P)-binding domain-containing protein [Streptomyces sp. H27-G5]MCY0922509.1 NAD(P)-binding domain-containing protein [Streptomyces sp. H27-G5]
MGVIALFGAGEMGEALLAGLVRSGHESAGILVVEPRAEHAQRLREEYGITTAPARKAAEPAETVLIVVRPQDVPGLLAAIAPHLRPDCLLVSGRPASRRD